jgi:hypothetical protein
MEREIIYGVFDKTTSCGSYTGFFRSEEDAQKELKHQMNRFKEEFGALNLEVDKDRVVHHKLKEIYFIIHPIVLR